jgi:hypothetical protein
MDCEVLVGSEWIVVDAEPAGLRDAVADAGNADMAVAPMASWTLFALPDGRMMRIALAAINGIRWHDDDDR